MKKKLSLFALGLLATSFIIACAKDSKENTTVYTPGTQTCQTGQYWNGYQCVWNTGTASNYTRFYATKNVSWSGNNTISASANYISFLRDAMGTCDRQHVTYGYYDCSKWVGGSIYIGIQASSATSNQIYVSFAAEPSYNAYFNWGATFPSLRELILGVPVDSNWGIYANPLNMYMNIHPINNSQGFQIQADGPTGSYAYNKTIKIIVNQGKLEDQRFNFTVEYNGQQMMSGTMVRY